MDAAEGQDVSPADVSRPEAAFGLMDTDGAEALFVRVPSRCPGPGPDGATHLGGTERAVQSRHRASSMIGRKRVGWV